MLVLPIPRSIAKSLFGSICRIGNWLKSSPTRILSRFGDTKMLALAVAPYPRQACCAQGAGTDVADGGGGVIFRVGVPPLTRPLTQVGRA
jgi:hypothetical protein